MKASKYLLFLAISCVASTVAYAQEWNREKYPDYRPEVFNPDPQSVAFSKQFSEAERTGLCPELRRKRDAARHAKRRAEGEQAARPDHVHNGATVYFPPTFNQHGGSCGSASRIGYMFTHEINAFRGLDGSLEENQYPTHFVWLLTNGNSGKDQFVSEVGVPSAKTYGGRTYSSLFGGQVETNNDFGWMTGYDKWYSGFFNKMQKPTTCANSLATEAGREWAKNWLWNHCGDNDFKCGGLIGLGVASGGQWEAIPRTDANDAAGVTGMYYVKKWGTSVDHALTLVGYDDRIEFDLDGNGVYGEEDKDEKGAWIIANSWGDWCNGGFIYCPYAYAGSMFTGEGKFNNNSWWYGELYRVRKGYRPLRTIKLNMDYDHRSEMLLQCGVSADLNATSPSSTIDLHHFRYAGDGANGDTNPAPAIPMLGRWADGKLHDEPMEFGYDLTDLSAGFDRNQPLKYFFIVNTKSWAKGTGHINAASIIDYENDTEGIETPFNLGETGQVTIQNKGKKTIISVIVYGGAYNPVTNLALHEGILTWKAPARSGHQVASYNIYNGGACIGNITSTSYSIVGKSGVFEVTALYSDGTESKKVSVNSPIEKPAENAVYKFNKSGFSIPDVFNGSMEQATIEFWIKPSALSNWNNAAGPGWGTWLQHCDANGTYYCGWDTGNRVTSSKQLNTSSFTHIAIVVNKKTVTLYMNGASAGSVTSSSYSGIGGFGDLVFSASSGNNYYQQAQYDEIRIWNKARTATDIKASYNTTTRAEYYGEVMPQGLVAYYKGATFQAADGTWYMRDEVGGHHAKILTDADVATPSTTPQYKDLTKDGSLKITAPASVVAGQPVTFSAKRNDYVNQLWWTIPGAGLTEVHTEEPTVTFTTEGQQEVRVFGRTYAGVELSDTLLVTVAPAADLDASFTMNQTNVAAGERVSFQPTTVIPGCTYVWSMPGAVKPSAATVSAGASYEKNGTYNVTLTVSDEAGRQASTTQKVTVSEVAPKAAFAVGKSVVMKGEKVVLEDQSRYAPSQWQWQLMGTAGSVVINGTAGGTTLFSSPNPGVFDVSLKVSNEAGVDVASQKNALIVVNADSKNGLNFSQQSAKVNLSSVPLPAGQRAYTIEWWMNPSKLTSYCLGIGDNNSTFQIRTDGNGAMSLSNKNKVAQSNNGFVLPNQWHHYAIVVNGTSVAFYRDGEKNSSKTTSAGLAELSRFSIGTTAADMNGAIDEFRIWTRNLTQDELRQYANAPLSAPKDLADLAVYYDFNQSGGNVTDNSAQGNTGQRTGFGPDGDAWALSQGVFSLNFNADVAPKDVTATYMKNYKRSFAHSTTLVNKSSASRFYAIKDWTLENQVVEGTTTTGAHVDKEKSYDFTVTTGWDGFSSLSDHKAFQTAELEAGIYTLNVTFGQHGAAGQTYLVAAAGETLPNTAELSTALGSSPLESGALTFIVPEKQTVSFGILVSAMSGQSIFTIQRFSLTQAPLDVREVIVPEGIISTKSPFKGDTEGLYDLTGRRVKPGLPGIVISQGRKVVQ